MKVLLTGAFGNVGQRTLDLLLEKGYFVRCFDIRNPRNNNIETHMRQKENYEIIWGDIRDKKIVRKVVKDIDVIIHLAAIIPPLAYDYPDLAYSVNVVGSTNLLEAAINEKKPPRLIFASSIAVHGNRMNNEPPTRVDDPLNPLEYDNYAQHKVTMEDRIRKSGIPWVILRFAAVSPFELKWQIPDIMYEIPLDQRIESVDSRDVALACVNAISADVVGKTLLIGGGKGNQLYQREYVSKLLNLLGIGMLPEEAFRQPKDKNDFYHCDWMDTKEAEDLLSFQQYSFDDFLSEFKKKIRFRRLLITLFRPIARAILLKKSPYYQKIRKNKEKKKIQKGIPISSG